MDDCPVYDLGVLLEEVDDMITERLFLEGYIDPPRGDYIKQTKLQ